MLCQPIAEAERVAPRDADIRIVAARLALTEKETGLALHELDQALEVDPKKTDALELKAQVLAAGGDPKAAVALMDQAVASAPAANNLRLERAGLLLADGQIVLDVERVDSASIATRVRVGGELSDRKGVNRQGGGISAPAISERDLEDIRFAAEENIDYLSVSFARDANDIERARSLLRELAALDGDGRITAEGKSLRALALPPCPFAPRAGVAPARLAPDALPLPDPCPAPLPFGELLKT